MEVTLEIKISPWSYWKVGAKSKDEYTPSLKKAA